jgi:hypothetical protein
MMKRTREHEKFWRKYPRLFSVFVALGFPACVDTSVAPVENQEQVRDVKKTEVLFIGNSYSFGVPKAFRKLAEKRDKKVRVGSATHGGWTLEQHAAHDPTLKKLRSRDWDVVVIQEQSLRPALKESDRRAVMDPAVRFFVEQAKTIGATPILYQTWGRRDGRDWLEDDDFFKMNARIREGYRSAAKRAGGVTVAPAGDAWEREFLAGRGQELFHEDGTHPSEFGDMVTAEVFYETIFGK